jgi:methylthioribose-1-phosphate isomerase
VEIEFRSEEEVLGWGDLVVAPSGSAALNPAFDVTPADLVTAIVTERRVLPPALSVASVAGTEPADAAGR